LHHRFVVGGYVRKRVTLRISKGLRAVALAAGISRRVYSDTRVIFITIIAIYIALAEKIGTPRIILVSERQVDHGAELYLTDGSFDPLVGEICWRLKIM
jgi:hypothetical protein